MAVKIIAIARNIEGKIKANINRKTKPKIAIPKMILTFCHPGRFSLSDLVNDFFHFS